MQVQNKTQFVSRESFIETMNLAANGVNVVTTDGAAGRFAATVSAMCSVTADDPTLLICLFKGSRLSKAISENKVFAVNLLTSEQQPIAAAFSASQDHDAQFCQHSWQMLATHSPIFSDGLAAFDCEVIEQLDQGSHRVFFAKVAATLKNQGAPLVYTNRQYCRTATI